MKYEFKVGDKVRVTKKRLAQPCSGLPENRNGVVKSISGNSIRVIHDVSQVFLRWQFESLEINDHRDSCACYDCAI